MTFLIQSPPYRDSSSGIRALWRLAHWLNVLGCEAYVVAEPGETPPLDWDVRLAQLSGPQPDAIAVYPEIVSGNPLGCGRVARWVLNRPGLLGGDTAYDPAETVFYSPQRSGPDVFYEPARAAAGKEVYPLGTSVHEPHLFYPSKRADRSGTCYFVYKGQEAFAASGSRFPTHEWHLLSPAAPVSRADLAFLFHHTEALYSWDPHSGITREAAICGVRTYIVDAAGATTEVPAPPYDEVVNDYLLPPVGIERLIALAAPGLVPV